LTLAVLDESGHEITEDNPLVTEHDGSTGDTVTRSLTLINKSDYHFYKNIRLAVNPIFPVEAQLLIGERVSWERVEYLDSGETIPFNLKLSVNPGTPEQVVRGINLTISGTRCLRFK